jgi:hypothetical protein
VIRKPSQEDILLQKIEDCLLNRKPNKKRCDCIKLIRASWDSIREEERERAAKIADKFYPGITLQQKEIALAIRTSGREGK